jgi:hypothetical protein
MDRIMGLYLDGVRSLIHSVSKDKKYRVLNLKQQSLVADYEPGEFELTYLLVEPTRKKSFVGDRCGSIYIFDIEPVPLNSPKPLGQTCIGGTTANHDKVHQGNLRGQREMFPLRCGPG